jgi:GntR family transcriptional regulator
MEKAESGHIPSDAFDLRAIPPLDETSALPLYMQLAERLISAIRSGSQLEPRARALPSEAELAAHFGISRPTVRQAMAHLVTLGLVTRSRGRGTFVAARRIKHDLNLAFEDEMRIAHRRVEFRVLRRLAMVPPSTVAERLRLAAGQPVDFVERLRLVDGGPFAHEQRFFPSVVGARVDQRALESKAIITLLSAVLGAPPARVTNTMRAVPADSIGAGLLGVDLGTPLLETEHTYLDEAGAPILHGIVRFRGDSFEFTVNSPVHTER